MVLHFCYGKNREIKATKFPESSSVEDIISDVSACFKKLFNMDCRAVSFAAKRFEERLKEDNRALQMIDKIIRNGQNKKLMSNVET